MLDLDANHRAARGSCGSSHPRYETKGLAPALEEMLQQKADRRLRKMEGTPGDPNQPFGLASASQEQVQWERFNLRKVDETDPLRQMDRQAAAEARLRAASAIPMLIARTRAEKPWDRLSRALRATDQVLQAGGFRVVVLDLGSVAPQRLCVFHPPPGFAPGERPRAAMPSCFCLRSSHAPAQARPASSSAP